MATTNRIERLLNSVAGRRVLDEIEAETSTERESLVEEFEEAKRQEGQQNLEYEIVHEIMADGVAKAEAALRLAKHRQQLAFVDERQQRYATDRTIIKTEHKLRELLPSRAVEIIERLDAEIERGRDGSNRVIRSIQDKDLRRPQSDLDALRQRQMQLTATRQSANGWHVLPSGKLNEQLIAAETLLANR